MLKGQAKTDYQRQYMRDRRSAIVRPPVRPIVKPKLCTLTRFTILCTVIPELDADGEIIPED